MWGTNSSRGFFVGAQGKRLQICSLHSLVAVLAHGATSCLQSRICSVHRSLTPHCRRCLGGSFVFTFLSLWPTRALLIPCLQLCSCLAVLGVFFAINAGVGISSSNHTISVVASVIVFVIFLLMVMFCAPLTFSTVFEADATRKLITFKASILGCISWRSMCSTCRFDDVQVNCEYE